MTERGVAVAGGAYERAERVLARHVERAPHDVEAALALVECSLRLAVAGGTPSERRERLRRAVRVQPYDARIRVHLAKAHLDAGEPRAGAREARAAIELAPREPWPHVVLGLASLAEAVATRRGELAKQAVSALDEAIRLCPSLAVARVARLWAASHMKAKTLAENPLLKLLPAEMASLPPSPELVPFMTGLCLGLAYAIFRRAPSKGAKAQATAHVEARRRACSALLSGLSPWLEAFGQRSSLGSIPAALEILKAEERAIAAVIAAAADRFSDPRLLRPFVRARLAELPAARRADLLDEAARRAPVGGDLDREELLSLDAAAREAVAREAFDDAEALWRRGLRKDPWNPALHHDLALVALARRDASRFAAHTVAARDLLLLHWHLTGYPSRLLERLVVEHEAFAVRLREELRRTLDVASSEVRADVVATWAGEALVGLVGRAALVACRGAPPPSPWRGHFVSFLRVQPALSDGSLVVPRELEGLLDPLLRRPPPLHYEVVKVSMDAPDAEVERCCKERREELGRALEHARQEGNREAEQQIRARVERLDAAQRVIADPARRREYDAECLSLEEHVYHRTRQQLVVDLFEISRALLERGRGDAAATLARIYEQVPHAHLDPYFDLVQPGSRKLIEEAMRATGVHDLLEGAQSLMNDERWSDAHRVLSAILAGGGSGSAAVEYLAAVTEMQLELDHVRRSGSLSAPGVPVDAGARRRLEGLGAAPSAPRRGEG